MKQQPAKKPTKEKLLSNLEVLYTYFLKDGKILWNGQIVDNYTDLRAEIAKTIEIYKSATNCEDISITDWDKLVARISGQGGK